MVTTVADKNARFIGQTHDDDQNAAPPARN
jgi:hypothetical protein